MSEQVTRRWPDSSLERCRDCGSTVEVKRIDGKIVAYAVSQPGQPCWHDAVLNPGASRSETRVFDQRHHAEVGR